MGFAFLQALEPPIPKDCETIFKHALCLYAFPPCNPESDQLLPVCSGSCNAVNRLDNYEKCDLALRFVSEANMESNPFEDFIRIVIRFDCNDRSSYIFYDDNHVDQNHCTDVLEPAQEG